MKKKIAIIGSGIAGLTLAGLLKKNSNFEFIMYEKEDNLNLDEGFGIQLSINSVSILNKIGFNQLNKNEKYYPSKLDFYSIDFNKVCDLDLTFFNSANEKYTTLKRSILVNFLKETTTSLKSLIISKALLFGNISKNTGILVQLRHSTSPIIVLLVSLIIFCNKVE